MSEMTLPSRHKIQNTNTGDLTPSTLALSRVLRVDGEETFLLLSNRQDREKDHEL